MIFDSITDYAGEVSKTFYAAIKSKKLNEDIEEQCLNGLGKYLKKHSLIFYDAVLSNILCQEFEKNKYKLIIVDGLRGRKIGVKLWLRLNINLFKKHIITKKWKKLITNYNLAKSVSN